jgi:hypothetical protein
VLRLDIYMQNLGLVGSGETRNPSPSPARPELLKEAAQGFLNLLRQFS